MRSPTAALLWGIWRQHQRTVAAVALLTAIGRITALSENDPGAGPSPLTTMMAMFAFVLLFGVFNYTESSDGRSVGRFPRRLFTLPVSSLRLVAVPLLAAIASIELLYLLWMEPLSRGASASAPYVAVLIGALVVFYVCVLWTLERLGALRLVVLGAISIGVFVLGLLPSFPPTPAPPWRSEAVIAAAVMVCALVSFLMTWRHVAVLRAGGRVSHTGALPGWIADAMPMRRTAFAGPAAAHFWFEWRSSGLVLPALVAGVVLLIVAPASWMARDDPSATLRLLLAVVAAPIVLAVPVGFACAKPAVWSEDLALPPFVAVRPLSSLDLIAVKVQVAAAGAAASWLIVVLFLIIWLPSWASLDGAREAGIQLWALHGRSAPAVVAVGVLAALTGVFLTWRFLVVRLWSAQSGNRAMFLGSVTSTMLVVTGGVVFDAADVTGMLLTDPRWLRPAALAAAAVVVVKYWVAVRAWRGHDAHGRRPCVLVSFAAAATFAGMAVVLWRVARMAVPQEGLALLSLFVSTALLCAPLARLGLAPGALARNRHR